MISPLPLLKARLLAAFTLTLPLHAQELGYATGTFATNAPAVITARPVGWAFPRAIDSVYTFTTGTGNRIAFKLPVGFGNTSIRPYAAAEAVGGEAGSLWNLAGRALPHGAPLGHGLWFSGPVRSSGTGAFNARTASAALQYRISVASQSAQYGDLDAGLRTLSENDNGTVDFVLPSKTGGAGARFKELLSEAQYNSLFPNRFGLGKTGEASDGKFDFYTYASFIKAIDYLSALQVKIVQRKGVDYAQKVIWTDTVAKVTRTMITHEDYNAEWNLGVKEDTVGLIRYGDFCAEGTLETRKRELAAFFAHIAHETGGGWEGAPNGGQYAWGLYWREEVAWQTNPNNASLGYVDASSKVYPPVAGKSYHGRGPIQVSWNYNYGQASEFLYGDKNVLLRAPEKILESGDVAFMTSIWFWMYPQGNIPASHDIMTGKWKPNAEDIAEGRDKSRFGATINVVNGVQECGRGPDERVADRVGHFKFFSGIFGVSLEPVLDCNSQQPF